jgi:DNA-binding SARP family transcriptional activator
MDRQLPVHQDGNNLTHRSGDMLGVKLLGGFALLDRGQGVVLPLGAQRLLAFLAIHPTPLKRAYVAGSLWPDTNEVRAAASLRSALWRLRRTALPLVCAVCGHLYLTDGVVIDAREVVARVRRLMDWSIACAEEDLDPLPLMGELLPDWSADGWVLLERERMRQLCLHGLEALCDRLLALGRHGEAVEAGLAAVRGEPLRESAHRAVISVHLAEGNHWEALRQFRWYQRVLRDELGIEPSSRITQLVSAL